MAITENLDTRGFLNRLIDYEMIYPDHPVPSLEDAAIFIKGIPSLNLLVQLATINLSLYLNDSSEAGLKMQTDLVKAHTLFKKASGILYQTDLSVRMVDAFRKIQQEKQWPFLFYRLSNLIFYDLIFQHFDDAPIRDFNNEEIDQFLHAYLIINSSINARIDIDSEEFDKAIENDTREKIMLPKFIYQKDFVSNSDYGNQVVRSYYFFEYLEKNPVYKNYIKEYYENISVSDRYDLINKLVMIFMHTFKAEGGPKCVFSLSTKTMESDRVFLNKLSFLLPLFTYNSDRDFTELRKRMFASKHHGKYVMLDISFFIDLFYKAQVFAFNYFLKTKGINNFLQKKGKEFMEDIYMTAVLQACFPSNELTKPAADLGDFHVRENNKMAILELKDLIMSSNAKNSGDPELFFEELDHKFVVDGEQKKGLTQLSSAVKKILAAPNPPATIYPIILYTDNAHGYDGLNKNFLKPFQTLIPEEHRPKIKGITFINISFFENVMNFLQRKEIDLFDLIDGYHQHIAKPESDSTPFEVYAMNYMRQVLKKPAETGSMFHAVLQDVQLHVFGIA